MTNEAKSELDQLTEQAEKARAALARAQAKADQERQAAEQRRTQAHEQFDRQTMDEYDPAPHGEAVEAAEAALRVAVLADPVWSALVNLNVALKQRVDAQSQYKSAVSRLRADVPDTAFMSYWPTTTDDVLKIVVSEGERRAGEASDAHDQARFDAGEEAARRRF